MDIVERMRGKKERVEIPCPDNIKGCAVLHFRLEVNPDCAEAADEIERLREDKAKLLKALTGLYESCRWEKVCPTIDAAKDAIAKALGNE
jgi:hypothetical protein